MNAEQLLRQLSSRLNLPFQSQDWGIINADSDWLLEFIDFYESQPLEETQRFQLGDLIFASGNERLLRGAQESEADIQALGCFIGRHRDELQVQFGYWSRLDVDDEFPLANVLRKLGSTAGA